MGEAVREPRVLASAAPPLRQLGAPPLVPRHRRGHGTRRSELPGEERGVSRILCRLCYLLANKALGRVASDSALIACSYLQFLSLGSRFRKKFTVFFILFD